MSDRPQQQPLVDRDEEGKVKPLAPLHNACVELAELKGEAAELKKKVDAKKEEVLDIMDEYDIDHYAAHGVEVERGRKATVKVQHGVGKYIDGVLQEPVEDEGDKKGDKKVADFPGASGDKVH